MMLRYPLLVLLLVTGCVSQSSLDGFRLDSSVQRDSAVFLVEHQPKDERNLDQAIATALRSHGLNAVTGPSAAPDYIVTYSDKWYWDMRMYLIDLRIDVREPETGVLVATGRSYQTSVAAMGRTHEDIIGAAVDIVVDGVDSAPPAKKRKSDRQRR